MATVGEGNRGEGGTASVELIAVLPFLVLAILAAAQIGAAGHALWSAAVAARAGARAAVVGSEPESVARRAVPRAMRDRARVSESGSAVTVRVPVAPLVPGLPDVSVAASSRLDPGDG